VPAEFVLGEMQVYRGERLNRSYSFIMGKLWDEGTQTEYVRIDFKTAVDSSLHSDHRYLLKRAALTPATQWLYLPALRRVRIVPYQPDDPLLQSDYLFYDLTAIQNFDDYHYRFIDANEQAPVIEGKPRDKAFPVPYEAMIFRLERRGESYVVTEITGVNRGKEKHARFSGFREIAPGRYRPQQLVVGGKEGRTELVFRDWTFSTPEPRLLTPAHLETQPLAFPATSP
jgi:Outer membrane lipoprotein-sorting protein